jgi:predicted NAD/FAD-dependent oxidoreductase
MCSLIILLLCFSTTNAFQFPLSIPFLPLPWSSTPPHRIAIIGAGAGGSSAAFWLARAQNRTPEYSVDIEVFEKETYVGGRAFFRTYNCGVFMNNEARYLPQGALLSTLMSLWNMTRWN